MNSDGVQKTGKDKRVEVKIIILVSVKRGRRRPLTQHANNHSSCNLKRRQHQMKIDAVQSFLSTLARWHTRLDPLLLKHEQHHKQLSPPHHHSRLPTGSGSRGHSFTIQIYEIGDDEWGQIIERKNRIDINIPIVGVALWWICNFETSKRILRSIYDNYAGAYTYT